MWCRPALCCRNSSLDRPDTGGLKGKMTPVSLRLSLVFAGLLAVAAWLTAPQGFAAARWLSAQDDPVALSELGLAKGFDTQVATREILAALADQDSELAESFVELARERGIALDPALVARVDNESRAAAGTVHN